MILFNIREAELPKHQSRARLRGRQVWAIAFTVKYEE